MILLAYAPIVEKLGDEFYGKLYPIYHIPKKDILKMIGNFNAKVGEEPNLSVGKFRLKNLNDAGAWPIDFWVENGLLVFNILHNMLSEQYKQWSPSLDNNHNK